MVKAWVMAGLLAAALLWLGRGALRLRARTRRLLADRLPGPSGAPVVVAARVEHLRTVIGREDACLPGLEPGTAGLLSVSEGELRLDANGTICIPMERVREAVFMASFEGARSAIDGVLVRVSWLRAEERLESVFRVLGKRLEAERLRREIHLRVGAGQI